MLFLMFMGSVVVIGAISSIYEIGSAPVYEPLFGKDFVGVHAVAIFIMIVFGFIVSKTNTAFVANYLPKKETKIFTQKRNKNI